MSQSDPTAPPPVAPLHSSSTMPAPVPFPPAEVPLSSIIDASNPLIAPLSSSHLPQNDATLSALNAEAFTSSPAPAPLPSSSSASLNSQHTDDLSLVAPPPPRKRSKWENQAAEEDELAIKIKKKAKLAAQERRRREKSMEEKEREERVAQLALSASTAPAASYALSPALSPHPSGGSSPHSSHPSSPRHQPPTIRPHSLYTPARSAHPPIQSCRSVYEYERLNHIEEGSYGVVFRAKEKRTGEIVALKKLKLDEEKNGFPITSLREVMALMVCRHENVVGVREIVVGDTLTQIFIVMDFIEHDLKSLLSLMPTPFLQSEVKTLLHQLLSATAHCHANWILHRDLKTSNLLMNNRGMIKVADFGLARKFGDPLGDMTQLVVTLWYRSPELLLGATEYSTAVDMWSIGCIFAELMLKEPLFQGKGEIDQINQIFKTLGHPTSQTWPNWQSLPLAKSLAANGSSYNHLPNRFKNHMTQAGHDLLSALLCYDPKARISAEDAMRHPYFSETPLPKHPSLFSSFPSLAAGEKRRKPDSPSAPAPRGGGIFD